VGVVDRGAHRDRCRDGPRNPRGATEDDEGLEDDEVEDWEFHHSLDVNPIRTEDHQTETSECTGDEVLGRVTLTATLDPEDLMTVRIDAEARLYEWDICSTDELEETGSFTVTLGPGAEETREFHLENPSDIAGDGDKLDLRITMRNVQGN
jgi:hypothetical protein